MKTQKTHRLAASFVVAAVSVAAWAGLAQATGPATQGITPVVESNVRVDDRIRINEKPGARVIVSHITVKPGGHTSWHYHPGPHIVSVRSGTVEVYETDCSFTTYPTGTGFFDPGRTHRPHVHTLRNPSATDPAEVVITDVRSEDLRTAIVVNPQPAPCFS